SEGECLRPDAALPPWGWGRGGGTWPSLIPCSVPVAFISKRASAEMARRHKRNYVYDSVYGAAPAWNPLEAKREVCELNPDCDELADHIGFQEAYRRFYGPV
uniref:Osteocalcin n=1 Tax=Anser cygnoides TaxID=8845 RepID=A0A8B9EUX8_ANSCY